MRYAHSHYQQISKPYTHIQGVQSYSKAKTAPCPGNLHTFETVLKMIQILFCSISSKYSTVSILRSYFLNYFFHNIVRALCLFIWLIICIHGLILPGYVLFFKGKLALRDNGVKRSRFVNQSNINKLEIDLARI